MKAFIYQNDLIFDVLESLSCHDIVDHGDKVTAAFPDGDNNNGITIFKNAYLPYHSFTRDQSKNNDCTADIIDLVRQITRLNYKDSMQFLKAVCNVSDGSKLPTIAIDNESHVDNTDTDRTQERHNQEYLTALKRERALYNSPDLWDCAIKKWYDEGISHDAVKAFGIKLECESQTTMNSKIWIPIRASIEQDGFDAGEIVAFNRRRTDESAIAMFGKYQLTPHYQKSNNIFGYYENVKNILPADMCVVFEGEKSVLKRYSVGDRTCVAIQGHSISEKQAELLSYLDAEIVIAFDSDVPLDVVIFECEKLQRYCKRVSYIFDSDGILPEKTSPADVGDELYKQLLDNRVRFCA